MDTMLFYTSDNSAKDMERELEAITLLLITEEDESRQILREMRKQAYHVLHLISASCMTFISKLNITDELKIYKVLPTLFKTAGSVNWSPSLVAIIKECVNDISKDYPLYLRNYVRDVLVATPQ